MKLRTRIIWISCIALVIASFVTEMMIWYMTAENKMNEAILQGIQGYYDLQSTLELGLAAQELETTQDTYMQYLMKKINDDYSLCFRIEISSDGKSSYVEIYNRTILTHAQLEQYAYQTYKEAGNNYEMAYNQRDKAYANEWISGRRYLIFRGMVKQGTFEIYHISDITYLKEELMQLAGMMFLITMVVTVITIVCLHIILKREFRPLQDLRDTAERMANGDYDRRVVVRRNDEIGELGENYNQMAEAVKLRTAHLVEAERRKTLFMGNLTHELKTPMTAISGYAQTLLTVKLSEEDQKEALLYIYKECGRLNRLSGKMMKLLELDSEAEILFQEVEVQELFSDVQTICGKNLVDAKVTLRIESHGERFLVDRDLMTDVLVNLVDNAIKASAQGSEIILRADEKQIQVQDFGKGIPIEEQERILEPFYMIDKSRSRKDGGAGLGLALAVLILKKHHATLTIESEVGKGSTFNIQLCSL